MNALIEMVQRLIQEKFWGELTIKFQDGKPVFVRREEHIKLG